MIHIDFEKFNKAGLKPILDKFEKAALPIASVDADNKAKRESGFQVKTAIINFESGQKLQVKAKAGGSIFQVKLNSKVLAIKYVDDLDKAIQEVIDYVKENEKSYQKQKEKQLARQKVNVPKIKPANVSVSEQITQFQTAIDETKAADDSLNEQIAEAENSKTEKSTVVTTLETELSGLVATGENLQAEYDQLKEVAA
jgi:hypothetical protein